MTQLNGIELQYRMKEIDISWVLKGKFIHREITFKDFTEAFAFMTSVASEAEKADHHPTWKNTYNKVNISLTTHDTDGLTDKDFALAKEIDRITQNHVPQD